MDGLTEMGIQGDESATEKSRGAQLCPALSEPMDCSPPGSSVLGIFQARMLEWVSVSYSRVSSRPKGRTPVSCISSIGRQILYHKHHLGKPHILHGTY